MADNFDAPQSRNEALLQNILGAENEIGSPQSRNEAILKAILEDLDEIPAPYSAPPQSRIEKLLVELWENGGGSAVLIEKTVTENGTYNAGDDNADGYSQVSVEIPNPILIQKSITENGTHSASDDEADGYSQVEVSVPPTLFRKLVDGSITTVTAEDLAGVTKIKDYEFQLMPTLNIELPETIQIVGIRAFYNSDAFGNKTVRLPNIVTIYTDGFRGTGTSSTFILGSTLTNLMASCFVNTRCTKVIIEAVTPPIIATNVFSYTYPIYVPNSSIENYKIETNWVTYASRLFPLVNTISDLSSIDTTTYTTACVKGADESYKQYTYDGTQWNEVTQ